MIQLATRHIVTPTQLAFSSQSGLVTIVTTTQTLKMRENDNARKENAAQNCRYPLFRGVCQWKRAAFSSLCSFVLHFPFLAFSVAPQRQQEVKKFWRRPHCPRTSHPSSGWVHSEALVLLSAALCCCSLCYLNSLMHFNGPENPKLPLPRGRSGLPPNTWFPRPTWVLLLLLFFLYRR